MPFETNSDIEELNSFNFKPLLRLKDMELHREYRVINAAKPMTRFGPRIVLELEDYQLFLPERYSKLSEAVFKKFQEGKYFVALKEGASSLDLIFSKGIPNKDFYNY